MAYKELKNCVCCDSNNLELLLDFNKQPLANNLKKHTDPYPLAINICKKCYHIQLTVAVDPVEMFSEYLYVSGTSETLRNYFNWFAKFALDLNPSSKNILDIACNDGSQLNAFKSLGLDTYGIDPATNLYNISSKNHNVVCDFINQTSIKKLNCNNFDIIVAQNVVAHTADPLDLLKTAASILDYNGVFLIQTSQANMIQNNEFDTIYHEHISFFCLNSLSKLAERAGLFLVDAYKTPIHGESWVFILKKQPTRSFNLEDLFQQEQQVGLHSIETYINYANKCKIVQTELKNIIKTLKNNGTKLVGYGAAAKGMTLLNSINESLDFIIDDNQLKVGLLSPGHLTPIVSKDILFEITDDNIVFIPLAWNFFKEIKEKIEALRPNMNNKYLKYFPVVELSV